MISGIGAGQPHQVRFAGKKDDQAEQGKSSKARNFLAASALAMSTLATPAFPGQDSDWTDPQKWGVQNSLEIHKNPPVSKDVARAQDAYNSIQESLSSLMKELEGDQAGKIQFPAKQLSRIATDLEVIFLQLANSDEILKGEIQTLKNKLANAMDGGTNGRTRIQQAGLERLESIQEKLKNAQVKRIKLPDEEVRGIVKELEAFTLQLSKSNKEIHDLWIKLLEEISTVQHKPQSSRKSRESRDIPLWVPLLMWVVGSIFVYWETPGRVEARKLR